MKHEVLKKFTQLQFLMFWLARTSPSEVNRKVKSGKSDVRVTSCETDNSFDHIDDSFFDEVAGKIPL